MCNAWTDKKIDRINKSSVNTCSEAQVQLPYFLEYLGLLRSEGDEEAEKAYRSITESGRDNADQVRFIQSQSKPLIPHRRNPVEKITGPYADYKVIWTGCSVNDNPEYKSVVTRLLNAIKSGSQEGRPEKLEGQARQADLWSRRISSNDRMVYRINGDDAEDPLKKRTIEVFQCHGHYDD